MRRQRDDAEIDANRSGPPAFGVDMDEDTIPLEAGIEDRAISLTKGCYVGQEVIIRVLHRGHGRVARRLVGLTFDAARGRSRQRATRSVPASGEIGARDERDVLTRARPARSRLATCIAISSSRDGPSPSFDERPAGSTPAVIDVDRLPVAAIRSSAISSASAGGNCSDAQLRRAATQRISWPSSGAGRSSRSSQREEVQLDAALGVVRGSP